MSEENIEAVRRIYDQALPIGKGGGRWGPSDSSAATRNRLGQMSCSRAAAGFSIDR
jgi:hypothetical protein